MKRMKKAFSILSTVLLILSTILVVAVFAMRLTGVRPKLGGYYFYNVVSESMTPMLKIDDVILVKACDPETLHKGDVITYHGNTGTFSGKDVTHQIIVEPYRDSGGTLRLQTKGIKAGAMEDPPITGDQVIGKYVMKLKVLSLIYKLFKTWYGLGIFLLILFVLIGKEMFNLMRLSDKADELEELPLPAKEQKKE